MYVFILTVTYLYSSLTSVVSTPAAYNTAEECYDAARAVHAHTTQTVVECRAVPLVNKSNVP